MKKNELMINDWVQTDGKYAQVLAMDYDYACLNISAAEFHMRYLEPIPLTVEILKANGLNDCSMFYDGWNFELTNKKMVVSVGVIWFVHELQHALRLCGLDDLADNFKIE